MTNNTVDNSAPLQPQNGATSRTMGPFAALLGILFRPGRTFAALRDAKRRWWIIPALIALLALAFYGYTSARASADAAYEQQLQAMEMMAGDPRMGEVVIEPPTRTGPHPLTIGLTISAQILGAVVTWLVWAGLLTLASTFFGQNGAKFGGFFAMVVWARLPFAIRNLIQAIYMTITGTIIYNQGLSGLILDNTPTTTSAGYGFGIISSMRTLQPTRGQQVLAALLGRVDAYLVWSLILTVAGVWAFARLPRRKAIVVTLVIWALATLVSLLPTIVGLTQGVSLF